MKEIGENWMIVLLVFICVGGCCTCNAIDSVHDVKKHEVYHEFDNECIYKLKEKIDSLSDFLVDKAAEEHFKNNHQEK